MYLYIFEDDSSWFTLRKPNDEERVCLEHGVLRIYYFINDEVFELVNGENIKLEYRT